MFEIELRAKADDKTRHAIDAACERVSESSQEDTYFSFVGDNVPVLRIRRQGGRAILNFKGIGPADGVWPEWETEIEGVDDLQRVLLSSKFEILAVIKKRRTRYAREPFEINVDEIEGLGTFVEAELMADDHERAHARIRALFREFGIEDASIVAKSYIDMLLGK